MPAELTLVHSESGRSGANVLAAIEVGRRLGPGAKVVTLICDSRRNAR